MHAPNAVETAVFLEALRRRHGYDFTGYAQASLRRRLQLLVSRERVQGLADLIAPTLRDPGLLARILDALVVPVSEMFRDPPFFAALRDGVLPLLRSYPELSIWLAGCAGGEEAYSVAIVLHEAGLLDKAHLFGTDIGDMQLESAEAGRFPLARWEQAEAAYRACGGRGRFADYAERDGDCFYMAPFLRRRISFAHHNLVADGVFCEAHLVLCRNVLIYFGRDLQAKVLTLFAGSLVRGGYLGLGGKEDLRLSAVAGEFDVVDARARLYRKRHRSAL